MAAEYTAALVQTVEERQNVLFTESPIPCKKGYVVHRDGSGIFRLRGLTNNCFARYFVQFGANIQIPEGGTVGPISLAIVIDGEPLSAATATANPGLAERYANVTGFTLVDVPRNCCATISIENVTPAATGAIDVLNANLIIERVA